MQDDLSDPRTTEGSHPENLPPAADGDFRGRFGFGRPAHGSDPTGTYVFDPELKQRRGDKPA